MSLTDKNVASGVVVRDGDVEETYPVLGVARYTNRDRIVFLEAASGEIVAFREVYARDYRVGGRFFTPGSDHRVTAYGVFSPWHRVAGDAEAMLSKLEQTRVGQELDTGVHTLTRMAPTEAPPLIVLTRPAAPVTW